MADQPSSGKPDVQETTYPIKGDLKTFQQLSSSGMAARKKRQDNQKKRIVGALEDAISQHAMKEDEDENRSRKQST